MGLDRDLPICTQDIDGIGDLLVNVLNKLLYRFAEYCSFLWGQRIAIGSWKVCDLGSSLGLLALATAELARVGSHGGEAWGSLPVLLVLSILEQAHGGYGGRWKERRRRKSCTRPGGQRSNLGGSMSLLIRGMSLTMRLLPAKAWNDIWGNARASGLDLPHPSCTRPKVGNLGSGNFFARYHELQF